MLAWFGCSLALLLGALSEKFEIVEKLWHPASYLLFPLSGAAFMVDALPPKRARIRAAAADGSRRRICPRRLFRIGHPAHYDLAYMALCNLVLMIFGFAQERRASNDAGARMIVLHDVSKNYPTRSGTERVLDGVNLSVNPGERVGILGRNGSGKSTLIRLISGAELPTSRAGRALDDRVLAAGLWRSFPGNADRPRQSALHLPGVRGRCRRQDRLRRGILGTWHISSRAGAAAIRRACARGWRSPSRWSSNSTVS